MKIRTVSASLALLFIINIGEMKMALSAEALHENAAVVGDLLTSTREIAEQNPTGALNLQIEIALRPGQQRAFENAFAPVITATRLEDGNLEFQINQHPTEPYIYFLYERWKNLAALEEHMETEHMKAFWPLYFPMLARAPEITTFIARELPSQ